MKRSDNRSKSVTMADIAAMLGVSVVTVSNALAGKKGVSPSVRAKVMLKARELGYLDGTQADNEQTEPNKKNKDIGIIAPQRCLEDKNGFCWQLYQEIITQLKNYESYGILDVVSEEDEKKLRVPRIIEKSLVSGLIILGKPELKFLTEINKWKIPIVFLDFSIRDFDFASVVGDDYYDMYRLTSFVISHGHSNIGYIAENENEVAYDRYYGYCRAAAESEIVPVQARGLEKALSDVEAGNPTAFICENHSLAMNLINKLAESGISVPEMVSVACFSDLKSDNAREITCVCRDSVKMAKTAVDILRARLLGEAKSAGRIAVGGKLVVGSTIKSQII